MSISIVSPVYLAENSVSELVNRLMNALEKIAEDFEIILVEDGSPDASWNKIEEICQINKKVKGIKLSRNFGQHYAITAGLEKAKFDWVVVMDCDLQDRPEEIEKLYLTAKEGYDIVLAQRKIRKDRLIKRMSSKLFYKIFAYLTDSDQDSSIANFGIYNRKVIKAVLSMKDYVRYFPTMVQWVGFKKKKMEVEHSERLEGQSSYSWKKLFQLALNNIISFSDKPLRLTVRLGLFISLISFMGGLYTLFLFLSDKVEVVGYTSLIISIWFLSGLIIFTLGMIGLYVGKTFDNVKNRPTLIIEESLNSNE